MKQQNRQKQKIAAKDSKLDMLRERVPPTSEIGIGDCMARNAAVRTADPQTFVFSCPFKKMLERTGCTSLGKLIHCGLIGKPIRLGGAWVGCGDPPN